MEWWEDEDSERPATMPKARPSKPEPATEESREPKYLACRRLKRDGRYEAFLARKSWFRHRSGGRMKLDDAFYAALKEFPPQ